MDEKRLTFRQQFFAFLLCSIVFSMVYNFSAWLTLQKKNVPSFTFDFEKNIPFLEWTIVPYMTSGILFCVVFFFCKSFEELKTLTKRMLFVTIFSGLIFIFLPLKFLLNKPEIENPVFKILFNFIKTWDSPFNQAPSLHISYALIFWTIFKKFNSKWKIPLMIWLLLLGISTMTGFQHHFVDVISGILTAHLAFIVFPFKKSDFQFRNFRVANVYFFSGWLVFFISLFLIKFSLILFLTLCWIALVMIVVGFQYQKNKVNFIKDKNGNISIFKKIFYFPYQLVYLFFWKFFRKKKTPTEILPNVFVSSRLSKKDFFEFKLHSKIIVYDLVAELEEVKMIRRNSDYHFVPFLDVGNFDLSSTKNLVSEISTKIKNLNENQKILIHCTMGFGRSNVIGILILKKRLSLNLKESIELMKTKNPHLILNHDTQEFLKQF